MQCSFYSIQSDCPCAKKHRSLHNPYCLCASCVQCQLEQSFCLIDRLRAWYKKTNKQVKRNLLSISSMFWQMTFEHVTVSNYKKLRIAQLEYCGFFFHICFPGDSSVKECRTQGGVVYPHTAQWRPNDCEVCECANGRVLCIPNACPVLDCPDPIPPVEGQCCGSCLGKYPIMDIVLLNAIWQYFCILSNYFVYIISFILNIDLIIWAQFTFYNK